MKRRFALLLLIAMLLVVPTSRSFADNLSTIQLGSDVLFTKFHDMIKGKKVGLVTNQTGVNSWGESTIELLRQDPEVTLTALYGPEHGIDGQALAGAYVESYMHPQLNIPVYSLYGKTRIPTEEMYKNIDVLLFDIQDIGARSYTYMSTLNYCLVAAKKYNKPVIVLDRPNPVGGLIVEGPIAKDPFLSFVGIDNLPMAHGMTAGELALFYNRKIAANLTVIPMEGYTRNMVYQDTGLAWIPSSPRMPDLQSVFGYMATGLGEGTGVFQSNFQWIGSKGLDSYKFANLLNQAKLPGVQFIADPRGASGGVKLLITDPHTFNPAKTGIYALAYARSLTKFPVPKSGKTIVMFDKIMGTNKIGEYLEKNLTPQQIEAQYAQELAQFKQLREQFLIYHDLPYQAMAPIFNNPLIAPVVTPTAAKPAGTNEVAVHSVLAKPVATKPAVIKPVAAKPAAPAAPVVIKQTAPKLVAYTFPYGVAPAAHLFD